MKNIKYSNMDRIKRKAAGIFLFVAAFLGFSFSAPLHAENEKPFVIPELTQWSGADGQTVLSHRIAVRGGKGAVKSVAEALAADYQTLTGKPMTCVSKAGGGDIVLQLKADKALGEEGYRLEVSDRIVLTAATQRGLFWGTRTILQLVEQYGDSMPRGTAVDVPQYAMRGFMIDVGRKFFPMGYLENLVKIMAYYKMNTLQVHLNDNGFRQFFGNDWDKTPAAFRLECETYPGLTAKDGSYSKQEFVDLQLLGDRYGVEIIPEIDVPAHSLAFTHYRPSLGSKEYGMDHLDLGNPETIPFVEGLLKEYLEGKNPVFRGKRVHVGTDEYSNAKKEVVEQFRYFTDRMIRYVESFGKQAMVWGALTHANGETPVKSENVIMNCWYNGYADPAEMKKQGYQLVSIPDGYVYIVPAAGYYYDYLNCEFLYDKWTPAVIGNQTFDEGDPAILGGMFAVWNDHAGNGISVKDVHHRVFPAMQTLATKCWTAGKTTMPYATFDARRKALSEAPGVNELGRLAAPLEMAEVKAGCQGPAEEVGYDYSVSFTVEAQAEEKGTVLFGSEHAVFYLSDPREGKLGFARDGYLNTFNYRLPVGQKVTLTVEGDNRSTRLLVDGKLREELKPRTLYVITEGQKADFVYGNPYDARPEVYTEGQKMYYQPTLVFPLRRAGQFKSSVTDLKVQYR